MAAKKALLDSQPHPLPGRLRIHETPPNGVCNGDSTIMVIKAKQRIPQSLSKLSKNPQVVLELPVGRCCLHSATLI